MAGETTGALIVLAAALALRITVAVLLPNLVWPDEVFQTVEPAHGLAFGTWMPTWEWVVGIRSWLIPAVLAPALWIGEMLEPGRHFGTAPVTALMLAVWLAPVAAGNRLNRQLKPQLAPQCRTQIPIAGY